MPKKPDHFKRMQDGWIECATGDGKQAIQSNPSREGEGREGRKEGTWIGGMKGGNLR